MIDPLNRKSCWKRGDLLREEWLYRLDGRPSGEITQATNKVRSAGLVARHFSRLDFPLNESLVTLFAAARQSDSGLGFALLRGLEIASCSLDDLERVVWGLGVWLGTAVSQDRGGEMIKHVRTGDGHVGNALHFHTDRCDTLVMLYARPGESGGVLQLVSVYNLYKRIMSERPDLAEVLFEELPQDRRGEHLPGQSPWMMLPIMAIEDGVLVGRYNRRFIVSTQQFSDAPRLRPEQTELLNVIDDILADPDNILEIAPEAGDIVLVNNHFVWHARTAYVDGVDEVQQRLMLRLWLANERSPRLPKSFEAVYGSSAPGVVRGGVPRSSNSG